MLTHLRAHRSSILWGAGTFLVLVVLFLVGQHLWQDHLDHHIIQEFLKYNIARGRLEPMPSTVTTAPVPPPLPPVPKD